MSVYESDDDSVSEFERLESTLPDHLKRSASSLLEAISNTNLNSSPSTTPAPRENHFQSSWLDSGIPSSRTPSRHHHHHHQHHKKTQHNQLIQKLSRSENGRESSPIPLPRPKFNEEIHKPAMNTKQSSTGVLWVTERANEYGFDNGNPEWANLGQGAPEHGDTVPGSFKRPTSIPIPDHSKEYAPTAGIKELREAVANYYNETYRQDQPSKYTYKNVCIVPGGRAGLTRIASIITRAQTSRSESYKPYY
ncbi:hypothetical protein QCA50_018787 [Cerrena zonata]|uniref:Uncharacterized protein n=1 Tax=Cerrena zonata TaxID=2478898 RepID=A0AAW0FDN6_9APHY